MADSSHRQLLRPCRESEVVEVSLFEWYAAGWLWWWGLIFTAQVHPRVKKPLPLLVALPQSGLAALVWPAWAIFLLLLFVGELLLPAEEQRKIAEKLRQADKEDKEGEGGEGGKG